MYSIKRYTGLLLVLLLFAACEKETNIDIANRPAQLVVLGELNQQDNGLVNLSTSVFSIVNSGFTDVEDAQVSLFDQHNNLIQKYTYNGKGNYTGKPGTTGQSYKLTVDYKGKTHEGLTAIPSAFQLDVKDLESDYIDVGINDLSPENNNYIFELLARNYTVDRYYFAQSQKIKVNSEAELLDQLSHNPGLQVERDTTFSPELRKLIISTIDTRTENAKYNELRDLSGRIFLKDKTFNGSGTTLEIRFHETEFKTENMQITLSVKSVNPEYFNYLYAMDLQQAKSTTGSLDVPLKGNMNNALGIFGGCYIQRIVVKK